MTKTVPSPALKPPSAITRLCRSIPRPAEPLPNILLVAATTGYQTRSFTAAAQRLGIDVTLATDRCHVLEDPWKDSAIPVRFEDPEIAADTLSELHVDGVIAVADRPTHVAALTALRLGLPWHSPKAVAACRDKHRMREIFRAAAPIRPAKLPRSPRHRSRAVPPKRTALPLCPQAARTFRQPRRHSRQRSGRIHRGFRSHPPHSGTA